WARPISPPSAVTAALLDMFCGLRGRTASPRSAKARASPATISDLPTSEPVPWNIRARAVILSAPSLRNNSATGLLPLPLAGEGWGGGACRAHRPRDMNGVHQRSSSRVGRQYAPSLTLPRTRGEVGALLRAG